MQTAEIVIIGGGVVGASVAYHLTERGCRDILVLEREAELGRGSTGKATGGVRAQFETEINIRFSLYSLDFFRNWEHDSGYEPRGYVFVATDDRQLEFLCKSGQLQRKLGYSGVRMVDTDEIAEIVPGLNCEDIIGGSFGPDDGFIDPLAVLEGFRAGAAGRGVRFETCRNVRSITASGSRIEAVETDVGPIECGSVVLCTGAWARELALTAGVDLPVEPERRQIVWAKSEAPLPLNLPMVIDLSDGFHFRPAKGSVNEVLFAYPDKADTKGHSTDFDEAFIPKVYKRARHRAPFLADMTVVRERCRAGLYETTPDHHAIIGRSGVDGLYLANGFSGHGVMHSPAAGRAVAEIIVDGEASFLDVSCLGFDRFANGKLLHETAFI